MTQSPAPKNTSVKTWVLIISGFAITLLLGLAIGLRLRPNATSVQVEETPTVVAQTIINDASPATGAESNSAPTANSDFMAFLLADARHFLGDANAPVTIIEFSDFK